MAEYKGKVNMTELREVTRKVFAYKVDPVPENDAWPKSPSKPRPERRRRKRKLRRE